MAMIRFPAPLGIESQKNNIAFDKYNDSLLNATWHYQSSPTYTWDYRPTDGVLTISGEGSINNMDYARRQPWYSQREAITSVVIENGITAIGNFNFYDLPNLTSVSIPDSVASIGEYAFKNCKALTNAAIGSFAFYGMTNLTEVVLADSVTSIGDYAFKNCSALSAIALPANLTFIGESAFYGCSKLSSIEIPAQVAKIGEYAFSRCSGLKEILFTGDAPTIGEGAFNRVTANATYPADNATWTSSVLQNYGGSITWKLQA